MVIVPKSMLALGQSGSNATLFENLRTSVTFEPDLFGILLLFFSSRVAISHINISTGSDS